MPIRIFTVPFNEETQSFQDDVIQQFCVNKRIHRIETKFFTKNNFPFWTVAIHYGVILEEERKNVSVRSRDTDFGLDTQQKALMLRLKEWRSEEANRQGYPVFLIASNAELAQIILQKCTTLESLKLVKGFGKSKTEKFGKAVTTLVKTFYES